MVERKLFKTKLCLLYQRGNCTRQTCSFAHGDAELRRFSGSSNGGTITVHYYVSHIAPCNDRREHKGNDLRDKLDRRNSPQWRYSSGRDARRRNAFHGRYDRGYSPLRSPGKSRKKQHLDGQSDVAGSLKVSDGAEGVKERHHGANLLEEQLKQVQLDIDILDDHKSQLEMYMEERNQEADILASRNEELEAQLSKEQDAYKRVTLQLTKFIKAHSRFSRAQEELKRSQARLQKLGDLIASDVSRPSANEEDSSVNIVSDGEPNHDNALSPRNELQNHASPRKRWPRTSLGLSLEAKPANSKKMLAGTFRSEKLTNRDGSSTQPENNCKEAEALNKVTLGSSDHRSRAMENNNKRRKNGPPSIASIEKSVQAKGLEAGHMLPSTSMAAHAVDELIEAVEMEETEVVGAPNIVEKGASEEKERFLYLPPPPPLPPRYNVHRQYEGEDDDVDVEQLDGETRDDCITSEVDTEQL